MFKLAIFLVLLIAVSAVTARRVSNRQDQTICDKYTASNETNADFMTRFVVAAVGAVAAAGTPTQAYFNGTIGEDQDGNKINFLTNSSALNLLVYNLVAFFGGVLGCSDDSIPDYEGEDMNTVHSNNDIAKDAWEYFNQQLVAIAQVAGFAHGDYSAMAQVLESLRGDICTQGDCFSSPYTITVGQGGTFFNPSQGYTFPTGSTISFVWYSSNGLSHSVTQSDGSGSPPCTRLTNGFDSGVHQAPYTFNQTFNNPGVYYFYCTVGTHCSSGGMWGTLNITGNAVTTGSTGSTASTSTSGTTGRVTTTSGASLFASAVALLLISIALLL